MVGRADRPRRPRQGRGEAGERGYTLVILLILVTTLNVLVAASLPAWSAMDQREKEEELIFRGLQYAEAIRVFQTRFGRLPVRLEELIEVEPRSIRKLWEDPLTGKAEWGLVFASAAGGAPGGPQGNQQGNRELGGDGGLTLSGATGGNRDKVTTGPIVGVYSLAKGDGIKTFFGKQSYADWRFTVDLLFQGAGGAGGQQVPGQPPNQPNTTTGPNGRPVPGQPGQPGASGLGPGGAAPGLGGPQIQPGRLPDLSARWIGRPWPPEIQAQLNPGAALEGGNAPGSAFGQPGSNPSGLNQPGSKQPRSNQPRR
jgi:type II secretory pathway pseudopilin PulG